MTGTLLVPEPSPGAQRGARGSQWPPQWPPCCSGRGEAGQELGLGCNSPFPSAPSRSRWGMVSWRTTVPPRRSCVSAARTSACWGAKSSGTGRDWDGALCPLVGLTVCLPPQSPAELEDQAAALFGQKAEGAGEGAGYRVGRTGLPSAVGWAGAAGRDRLSSPLLAA